MPHQLRNLKVSRVALVDKGANHDLDTGEGAHVVLYKSHDPTPDQQEDAVPESTEKEQSFAKRAWSWIVDRLAKQVDEGVGSEEETQKNLDEFAVWLDDNSPESQAASQLHKMGEPQEDEPMPVPEKVENTELPEEVQEAIQSATKKAEEATARAEAAEAALAEATTEPEEQEDALEVAKSHLDPAVRKHIESLEERTQAAENIAKAERENRLGREYFAKAGDLPAVPGQRTQVAEMLRAVDEKLDSESAEKIRSTLKSMNATIASGHLLASFGGPGGSATSAFGKINAIAKTLLEDSSHSDLDTQEKAFDEALRRNPTLYEEYQEERQ